MLHYRVIGDASFSKVVTLETGHAVQFVMPREVVVPGWRAEKELEGACEQGCY